MKVFLFLFCGMIALDFSLLKERAKEFERQQNLRKESSSFKKLILLMKTPSNQHYQFKGDLQDSDFKSSLKFLSKQIDSLNASQIKENLRKAQEKKILALEKKYGKDTVKFQRQVEKLIKKGSFQNTLSLQKQKLSSLDQRKLSDRKHKHSKKKQSKKLSKKTVVSKKKHKGTVKNKKHRGRKLNKVQKVKPKRSKKERKLLFTFNHLDSKDQMKKIKQIYKSYGINFNNLHEQDLRFLIQNTKKLLKKYYKKPVEQK